MKNINHFGFLFDLNKCVGCQACQIACSIENELGYDLSWREINTYNPGQIQELPHYHLSMACNHCSKPVCMYQCPAKAISKNPENGIVIIEENKCIGCKFCSWVCPYDAPKFNSSQKVMTKCTMCNHRLEENLEPACVSICPTDALNIVSQENYDQPDNTAGFPKSDIDPCMQIEPLKQNQSLPAEYSLPYSKDIMDSYSAKQLNIKNKVSIKSDWTLIIFSFLISVLGAWLSTALFRNVTINTVYFLVTGFMGMGLSTLHLGQKRRAWRAILNWKTSWLSREVLFFSSFLFLSVLYLYEIVSNSIGFITLATGYLAAISADHVYAVIARPKQKFFHSAQVWLTFLFLVCFFNQILWGVYLFGIIKMILYTKNKIFNRINYLVLFVRITSFIIAIIYLIQNEYNFAIISILISELIDRFEFYSNLYIITPRSHMNSTFQKRLTVN